MDNKLNLYSKKDLIKLKHKKSSTGKRILKHGHLKPDDHLVSNKTSKKKAGNYDIIKNLNKMIIKKTKKKFPNKSFAIYECTRAANIVRNEIEFLIEKKIYSIEELAKLFAHIIIDNGQMICAASDKDAEATASAIKKISISMEKIDIKELINNMSKLHIDLLEAYERKEIESAEQLSSISCGSKLNPTPF